MHIAQLFISKLCRAEAGKSFPVKEKTKEAGAALYGLSCFPLYHFVSVFCFLLFRLIFLVCAFRLRPLTALTRGVRQNADGFPQRSNNTRSFRRPPPDDPYRPPE